MVIVVKVGGRVLEKNIDGIVRSVAKAATEDRIIFVHGGGDIVTEMCKKLGIEPKFVVSPEGIRSRYTDEKELEVYVMVMAGKLNKTMVSKLIALNVKSIGISGADGPTLIAERKKRIVVVDEKGKKRVIDGGYTGKIIKVDTNLIQKLLDNNYVVVVAPIAIDNEGTLLNVDGDQAAYAIASAFKAKALIVLTDVEGVIINNSVVREIKTSDIDSILENVGVGMNRKILLAKKAIEEGVEKIIISSGLVEDSVFHALRGAGTTIIRG